LEKTNEPQGRMQLKRRGNSIKEREKSVIAIAEYSSLRDTEDEPAVSLLSPGANRMLPRNFLTTSSMILPPTTERNLVPRID
jgi:hypothetical protein